MSEEITIERVAKESKKAFLCVDASGVEGWIKKCHLTEAGTVSAKIWAKAVSWTAMQKAKRAS